MSKKVMNTKLRSGTKKLSGDNIKTGPCVFPFKYKGELYNECFKGKYGDWCATEVDPETKKMRKYAFCDYASDKLKKKKQSKKKVVVKPKATTKAVKKTSPKAKQTSPKTKKAIPKAKSKQLSPKAKQASPKTKQPSPKSSVPKTKKKYKIKTRDPLQGIDSKHLIQKDSVVSPKIWELPNRKTFPNWMYSTFKPYLAVKNSMKTANKTEKFSFFKHQKLVRDYLQSNSPFRGLLLYHGLGVGKTCASIGIAEGFRSDRKIVILLNKSLKKNFRVNLLKCGFDYFRTNQHWVHVPLTNKDDMYYYMRYLGLTRDFLEKNKGCMVVDFTKKSNYEDLSAKHRELLHNQIDVMIDEKYEFIHLDGLNRKKLEKMVKGRILDNKLLIIDEVHNLTNAMAKDHPGFRAQYIKQLIMDADNLKCVFLSGTPMINKLIEAGQMFNLLRGYITQYVFTLNPRGTDRKGIASLQAVLDAVVETGIVDQYMLNRKDKKITLTRVPTNFVSLDNEGLIYSPVSNLIESEFIGKINSMINEMGYSTKLTIEKHTAFPEEESKFLSLFFDSARNKIRNPELFQSRILGLTSYFKTNDRSLLPEVTTNEVIDVPMSNYQFLNYSQIRKAEIELDQNRRKKKGIKKSKSKNGGDGDQENTEKSSYRAYSRMHCSFVFPETIPRPYPSDKLTEDELELLEKDLIPDDDDERVDDPLEDFAREKKAMLKKYEQAKEQTLKKLDKEKHDYLVANDANKLAKYSPKYNLIMNKILTTIGNIFVYTEYRSLEGIAVFEKVLKANGFAPFLLKRLDDGDYEQIYESPDDVDKPKFALWGGDPEMSDIIRKVYNNEFVELPPKLQAQIMSDKGTNLRGETLKVLLTTKTGAEGIDLKNVRQVHIIEPFWNPVRLSQVKGRAVRVASHVELPPKERTVEIYTYIASIKKEDLKSDRIINDDSDGQCSDQVLYNISARKLQLMEDLLRLISEASIDCVLNSAETTNSKTKLNCVNYGAVKTRNYVTVPDIDKEVIDSEKNRVVKKTTWKPVFINIPIKGRSREFALRKSEVADKPSLLFNAADMRLGIVGEPVGELYTLPDGRNKITFYKRK